MTHEVLGLKKELGAGLRSKGEQPQTSPTKAGLVVLIPSDERNMTGAALFPRETRNPDIKVRSLYVGHFILKTPLLQRTQVGFLVLE